MMTLTELLNEAKQLKLQEQVQLATQLLQWVEIKLNQNATSRSEKKLRQPGLNRGSCLIADDFDEPLPDDFWLGES
ncbi:hypothetical protein [Crocosphaera sp. XPORK-15E]|uniref:hypothetical protein n=1 Tax=Crocosphaera sp. XPORK-15E TaxID=3110247 RepID=UPI002B1F5824|nr:hypothetical protein [Crocosphaera sp. XPORK-15E]MEA5535320.1 hypothetical protein [Crocosphaera sp. XPORK-15E]